ncbi:MAG: hypothetical protein A3H71_01875 [Candidatus Sungbacteria bacterium RIFCSPLOWO2_02_FULL_48_13b]|uniref:Glycosyltransferase 2-like domain-containing protein n=2 Tax=Candidatus Sungiibacteriota TaxID=1817917 RepID=A0A1G2LFA8_9BACT|nr:MAG: hypothetical protein A3C12_01340 [Candidatus Sungbacteria bacterium RIFCSPHIGHO2_02_FULL_49_20]OHA10315.1 MAG: hypothetical protein A3H71_01875 [Candidatus Sungbacteria bacterium RIFCSPLOWO2_02_FULL_48_13b]
MMPKIKATVEILAYNNQATIDKTLASVADFDEILVIDGGSTDRTRDIARQYGATILEQDARGKRDGQIADFSLIRNQGLIAAKHDWFLFVDSDELLTQDLVEEIRSVVVNEMPHSYVWWAPRKYVYNGKVIDCATTYPNFQMRFFHRRHVEGFVKEIHERILSSSGESIGKLRHCILVPIPEREVLWKKWSRYVLLEEERLRGSSRRDILVKAFNTLKAAALYALRLPRFWICRGNHTPFWYEFLQQRYQFTLLRMLLRNLL